MMWLARLKLLAAVAAALVLATAAVAVQERQRPAFEGAREDDNNATRPKAGAGAAAPDVAANRALAKEQLALIDKALEGLRQEARFPRGEKIGSGDASFSLWERRRVEILRRTGAEKAEIVAAIERLIDTLKLEEAIAVRRHQTARGTLVDLFDVQFRRIEAEIWLNEEKAR
jgi:hypothetical protein